MREHIHAPAYNEGRSQDHRHEPRWDEPSRGANGRAAFRVENVDMWENDAFLVCGDKRFYFQFGQEPSVSAAIAFLQQDGDQDFAEFAK